MAASTFDGGVVSRCVNNAPVYVGLTLNSDGITSTETMLTQQEYIDACNAMGASQHLQPCSVSAGGSYQPHSPAHKLVFGGKLTNATKFYSKTFKVPSSTELQVMNLERYRPIFQMMLRNNGVRIYNPNNMYEILAKVADLYPGLKSPSNMTIAAVTNPKTRKMITKSVEASGGGGSGMDMSWLGDLVGMVGGIAAGINNGSIQNQLAEWSSNYTAYMQTDFAAIAATLQANGAAKALEAFYGYKNGSWAEMKQTITQYCSQHSVPIPNAYEIAWAKQDEMEANLKSMVPAGSGAYNGGGNSSGTGATPTGNQSGNGGGTTPPDPNKKSGMTGLLVIVVIAVVLALIFGMGKKS